MDYFYTKEIFGHKIESLWENKDFNIEHQFKSIKERGFAIQNKIYFESIMFIGINPSYNDKTGPDGYRYYDTNFIASYPYFKEFSNVSHKIGAPWSHLDIVFIRETNQKIIQNLNKDETPIFWNFLQKQYTISKEIITYSKPIAIVICNAFASEWIRKDESIRKEFDNELGTYRIIGSKLDGIPLFFSGMLTGQRSLDKGSRERLIWHIKRAIDTTKRK